MPRIVAGSGVITQINTFDILPGKQQALLELLQAAARHASEIDGWMSASLHMSLDEKKLVNYAQCRDHASWERSIAHLHEADFIKRNKEFGTAHPGLYQPVFTLERNG